jgi:hypothetical protein
MMAHFALVENGVVTNVIVVADSDCGGEDFPKSEPIGQAFIASIGLSGEWKQTSYNTYKENGESKHKTGGVPFRGKYAGIGDTYDPIKDEFINGEVSQ